VAGKADEKSEKLNHRIDAGEMRDRGERVDGRENRDLLR